MTNRSAVKDRLVTIATAALQSVDLGVADREAETIPVRYGLPPDDATEAAMYFGGYRSKTDGTIEVTAARRGSDRRKDEFVIAATIDVFGFATEREAEEAAERALGAFTSVLHGRCSNSLVDSQGDIPNGDPSTYRVAWAVVADWSLEPFANTGDTFVARIELSIGCSNPYA